MVYANVKGGTVLAPGQRRRNEAELSIVWSGIQFEISKTDRIDASGGNDRATGPISKVSRVLLFKQARHGQYLRGLTADQPESLIVTKKEGLVLNDRSTDAAAVLVLAKLRFARTWLVEVGMSIELVITEILIS